MKENTRTKNSMINVIFSFILQFSKILLVFINRVVFVKILGASVLGINGLFSNVLGILSLADMGITTAMMYSLYKPLADNDSKSINKYMNYFKKIYNYIAIVIFIVGIALIPFLKFIVNLPEDIDNIYLYYIILLINTVMSYLFVYQTTLIIADQKQYIIDKIEIISQYMLFVVQLAILIIFKNFTLYLLSNVIITLLFNLLKVRKVKKEYPFLKEKQENETLTKSEKNKIFDNIKSLFIYKLGSVILSNTDNILISIFVGTITVGYYSNYLTIISSIVTLLTMIFTSIKASLGNFIVEKDKKQQLKMFYLLDTMNFWMIGYCSICFLNLTQDFINLCFGKEYLLSFAVLIIAILNFYTANIKQVIWAFRETSGLFKKTKYINIVTSVLNIIFSIILGKLYGLVGIIGATILSRMLYSWWKEPLILFKDYFNTSPKKYYFTYLYRVIIIIIIGIISNCTVNLIDYSNLYISIIIKFLISTIITGLLLCIIYRKSNALLFFINKLKGRRNE